MAFIVSTGSFRHTFMVMLSKKNSQSLVFWKCITCIYELMLNRKVMI